MSIFGDMSVLQLDDASPRKNLVHKYVPPYIRLMDPILLRDAPSLPVRPSIMAHTSFVCGEASERSTTTRKIETRFRTVHSNEIFTVRSALRREKKINSVSNLFNPNADKTAG